MFRYPILNTFIMLFSNKILLEIKANIEDPNQTAPSLAYDLFLYCLSMKFFQ